MVKDRIGVCFGGGICFVYGWNITAKKRLNHYFFNSNDVGQRWSLHNPSNREAPFMPPSFKKEKRVIKI